MREGPKQRFGLPYGAKRGMEKRIRRGKGGKEEKMKAEKEQGGKEKENEEQRTREG